MRILGIIPARGGSKGVPRKNIKRLNGLPLIAYTIASASESTLISNFIVSTEDQEIAKVSREHGANVPFLRPAALAQDETPTLPVLIHALEFYQSKGVNYDAVCILQATTPFRPNGLIDECIKQFVSEDADTLISVKKVPTDYNPHWVFFQSKNKILKISTGEEKIIPRRQMLPDAFHRDGMIYLVKSNVLSKNQSLYGKKLSGYITDSKLYINIDTPGDWEQAEVLAIEYCKSK